MAENTSIKEGNKYLINGEIFQLNTFENETGCWKLVHINNSDNIIRMEQIDEVILNKHSVFYLPLFFKNKKNRKNY